MGRTLVQGTPTECGVSECDLGTSYKKPRPTGVCEAMRKNHPINVTYHSVQDAHKLYVQRGYEPCPLDHMIFNDTLLTAS